MISRDVCSKVKDRLRGALVPSLEMPPPPEPEPKKKEEEEEKDKEDRQGVDDAEVHALDRRGASCSRQLTTETHVRDDGRIVGEWCAEAADEAGSSDGGRMEGSSIG